MLTLAVVVFSACVVGSLACSCWMDESPDRFCRYPVVFRGMAKAEWEERDEPLDHSDPLAKYFVDSYWMYSVEVDKAIIMPESLQDNKTIVFRSSTQDSLCGRRFPVDVTYVFFGWVDSDGVVSTGICEPNTVWDDLDDWNRELIVEHIPDYCANKEENGSPPEP